MHELVSYGSEIWFESKTLRNLPFPSKKLIIIIIIMMILTLRIIIILAP